MLKFTSAKSNCKTLNTVKILKRVFCGFFLSFALQATKYQKGKETIRLMLGRMMIQLTYSVNMCECVVKYNNNIGSGFRHWSQCIKSLKLDEK